MNATAIRPLAAVPVALALAWPVAVGATDPDLCSATLFAECLNGVSSSVTAFDTLRLRAPVEQRRHDDEAGARRTATLQPLRLAAGEGVSGVLASDPWSGWALWVSARRSDFAGRVAIAPYSARMSTASLGADKLVGSRLSLGFAVSHERTDTRTRFNAGGQHLTGATLIGYGSYLVSEHLSADFNGGWGRHEAHQNRVDPANGATLTARHDNRRRFAAANLNYSRPVGAWHFGAHLGLLEAREVQDGYTEGGGPSARVVRERTVKLTQAALGADLAYDLGRGWQAYGGLTYRHDLSRDDGASAGGLPGNVGNTQPSDRNELEWVLGLRLFGGRQFTASLEFLKTSGRDQFDNEALTLLGRYDF